MVGTSIGKGNFPFEIKFLYGNIIGGVKKGVLSLAIKKQKCRIVKYKSKMVNCMQWTKSQK